MPFYTVYSLDVWGNPVDGFEVNDRFKQGKIYLRPGLASGVPPDAELRGVVDVLIKENFLNDLALEAFDRGDLQVTDFGYGSFELAELEADAEEDGDEVTEAHKPILSLEEEADRERSGDGVHYFWSAELTPALDIQAYFDDEELSFWVSAVDAKLEREGVVDFFRYDLKAWTAKPRFGMDPITGEELDAPTKAQVTEILVALDYFMERGKAHPDFV